MYTAGIDLCDDYITAYSGTNGVSCSVPCAVCREKHEDIWHIGENAYRMALSGEGVLTDKLLTLLSIGSTSTIMRKTYSAKELLSKLIEQTLLEVTGGQALSNIDRLVVALHVPDSNMIKKVLDACIDTGIEQEKISVISHEEAFIHYTLSCDKELYSNQVSMFDLSGEKLSYYEFMVVRGISKNSVVAEGTDLEESFRADVLKTVQGASLADHILKETAVKHMQGKLISSVFLTGKGFERTEWAKDFLSYICVRKRVLYEKELFAIGADRLARKQADGIEDEYLFFCNMRVKFELSMPVIINDREQKLILLSAGQKWIGTCAHVEVVPRGQDYIHLNVEPIDKNRKSSIIKIKLKDFPKRPDRCTRLSLDLICENENEGTVIVKDMGFGDLFPSSDVVIEEKFRIV